MLNSAEKTVRIFQFVLYCIVKCQDCESVKCGTIRMAAFALNIDSKRPVKAGRTQERGEI